MFLNIENLNFLSVIFPSVNLFYTRVRARYTHTHARTHARTNTRTRTQHARGHARTHRES